MKILPKNVKPYLKTRVFTQDTIPDKLLADHNTKEGSWGVINIEEGQLEYKITGEEAIILSKDKSGIIEPTVKHHIKPIGSVSFYIEFYRAE